MPFLSYIQRIQLWTTLFAAFWLPTYLHSSVYIALIVALVCALLQINKQKTYWKQFDKLQIASAFLLLLFYLLHVIAYFYSNNKAEANYVIRTKGLFIFLGVLLFLGAHFYQQYVRLILKAFVAGNLMVGIACLFIATYNAYVFTIQTNIGIYDGDALKWSDFFMYYRFAFFMHPSYWGMYLVFAASAVFYLYQQQLLINPKTSRGVHSRYVLLIVFFLFLLWLLSSRAAVLSAGLCLAVMIIFLVRKRLFLSVLVMLLVLSSAFIASYWNNPRFNTYKHNYNTYKQAKKQNDTIAKSNKPRIDSRTVIWAQTWDIISKNWLTGVGTGDVVDELIVRYKSINYKSGEEQTLNAHNQYLETFAATGIIGITMLLLLFLIFLLKAIQLRSSIMLLFVVSVSISFMFESILERNAGTLFFAFIYSLLMFSMNKTHNSIDSL